MKAALAGGINPAQSGAAGCAHTLKGFGVGGRFEPLRPSPADWSRCRVLFQRCVVDHAGRTWSRRASRLSEVVPNLLTFGLATEGAGTPETTAKYIRDEQNAWLALAKELGIQPQ